MIVAAHGRDELRALRRALEAGVAYVGLVASPKRGAGVLDELRGDGVPDELLERIDVPAGIAIGSRTPARGDRALDPGEGRRGAPRGRDRPAHHASSTPDPIQGSDPPGGRRRGSLVAVDPICGMTVAAIASTLSVERDGETVYFCSDGCKAKFEAEHDHASLAG